MSPNTRSQHRGIILSASGIQRVIHREGSANTGLSDGSTLLSEEEQSSISTTISRFVIKQKKPILNSMLASSGEGLDEIVARADALYLEFHRWGKIEDINTAIEYQSQIVWLTEEGDANRPRRISRLGNSYLGRFKRLGRLSDVNKAITLHTRALSLMPEGDPETLECLGSLGASYHSRFLRLGEVSDVDKAIEFLGRAITLGPSPDPGWLDCLTNLGSSYLGRFEYHGQLSDVEKAVDCHKKALSFATVHHPSYPAYLSNLGNSYLCRFQRLGGMEDIYEAIHSLNWAALLTPDGHEDKPAILGNIGASYFIRFGCQGELEDVDKAIEFQEETVLLTPSDHADLPGRLSNLGSAYLARFKRVDNVSDADKAIQCLSQAVWLTPDGHANKPTYLKNLGDSYHSQFIRLGKLSVVNKAIDCLLQAVTLTHDRHADKATYLNDLGTSYLSRFEHSGELSDVNKAIDYQHQVVQLTPDDHSDRAKYLSDLAASHLGRFDYLGEVVDIDEAIDFQGKALKLTPQYHVSMPGRLSNLGSSYHSRFKRFGEVSDIDKAIHHLAQAVLHTPTGHAARPGHLCNLGVSFLSRFSRLGALEDVDVAISNLTEAASLATDDHADKPGMLSNLGVSYMTRFKRRDELDDINKAIEYLVHAVSLTSDSHIDKAGRLRNLGISYLSRFRSLGDLSDADKAIGSLSQVVSLTPEGHEHMPAHLALLGNSYHARFRCTRVPQDLETATGCFQEAAQSATGHTHARFHSSCMWARLSFEHRISYPLLAYQQTMKLLPQLVWLGTAVDQRYRLIAEIGNVATEAAACAITLNGYDCALEWLEESRSIVWNQILQLRTSFKELSAIDPALAQRLSQVGRELEQAGSRAPPMPQITEEGSDLQLEARTRYRHALAAEWDSLLNAARLLPGFQNITNSRGSRELKRAARDGPVAVINVHTTRCDALIILPHNDKILHVPLDNFSRAEAIDAHDNLAHLVGWRHRGFSRVTIIEPAAAFKRSLGVLWTGVVKPVLDSLGYTHKLPMDKLPHLTWCTTGPLAFLPLHAAGSYDGYQPNAFDLVISSYTPTLSALLAPTPPTSPLSGVVAVGQANTIGLPPLPYTERELEAIKEHTKSSRFLQLDGDNATVESVLKAMDEYSWVHLACHATQHPDDPAQSSFYLHGGRLTLSAITNKSFKNKGLAFLSACETAAGNEELPDEAVHLAAGMLMAGYPSVIATMWSVQDEDAPEVAGEVYSELLRNGEMDCTRAAIALHKAVASLREKVGHESFNRWATFIHIGL